MPMIDKMMGKMGGGPAGGGLNVPPAVDSAADKMGIGAPKEEGALDIFDRVTADLQLLAERVPEVAGLARRFEALRPKVESVDASVSSSTTSPPPGNPGQKLGY